MVAAYLFRRRDLNFPERRQKPSPGDYNIWQIYRN
jgi:hypothetical protein